MNIVQERNFLAQAFASQAGAIPQWGPAALNESYLRIEKELRTQDTIVFDPLKSNSNSNQPVTANLLNQNDAFIVTHIGFAWKYVNVGENTTTDIEHALARLQRFANLAIPGIDPRPINAVYNGYLRVDINKTEWFSSIDMTRFERVGVSQEGLYSAVTADTSDVITGTRYSASEQPNGLYGYYPVAPYWLSGTDYAKFTVQLPTSVDFDLDPLVEIYPYPFAVLLLRGYLVNNGNNFGK